MSADQPPRLLEVELLGTVTVGRFTGEVTLSGQNAETVGEQVLALLAEPGRQRLLLDFGNVKSLSSLVLGKLIQLNRAAESAGGRLALCNLRPEVREILEVTRLTTLLYVYDEEQEALRSF
jgi:anti-sigma B factor antagonist